MVNQQQATQALMAWKNGVDATHAQLTGQAAAPEQSWGEWFVEGVVNGAASIGYAAIQNPEAVLAIAGGAAVAVGGVALATGGGVVSASGVGAVAGVPAFWTGAGIAAAGGLGAAAGVQQLVDAARQNPVEPLQMNASDKAAKETKKIREHQQKGSDAVTKQEGDITQDPSHAPQWFRSKEESAPKRGWFW